MTLAAVNVEVSYDTRPAVRATTLALEPGQLVGRTAPERARCCARSQASSPMAAT